MASTSYEIMDGIITKARNSNYLDDALSDIVSILRSPGKCRLVVSGPAGSGKTTLVNKAIKEISGTCNIIMSAPTHKAVKVMCDASSMEYSRQSKGKDNEYDSCYVVTYQTTESALGMTIHEHDDGRLELVEGSYPAPGPDDVLVIDEASMLDYKLFNRANAIYNKILFVGDPYQLQPISSGMSPVFRLPDRIRLNKIIRQDTDDLAGIVAMARDAVVNRDRSIANKIKNRLRHVDEPISDGINSVVITYRNRAAESINAITGKAPKPGDAIIAMDSFKITRYGCGDYYFVYNSDILKIASVGKMSDDLDIKAHEVITECGKWLAIPESYEDVKELINAVRKNSSDKKIANEVIKSIRMSVQPLRKANAITAHKSQGSTYDHVIVAIDDLMRCNDPLRALYVAVSRARKTLAWC
jgi:ATP-dependent exoDNAse (exonuclease V) alpha subunit